MQKLKIDARGFRETGGYVSVYTTDLSESEVAQRQVDAAEAAADALGRAEKAKRDAIRERLLDAMVDAELAKGVTG